VLQGRKTSYFIGTKRQSITGKTSPTAGVQEYTAELPVRTARGCQGW